MTSLSSFMCPQCKKRHYTIHTVRDVYTCLYCGKDMKSGEQITEPVYDVKHTDMGIEVYKRPEAETDLDIESSNIKSDTQEVFERLYKK